MFLYFLKSLILIHNHEVAGSIPAPATKSKGKKGSYRQFC